MTIMKSLPSNALQNLLGRHCHHLPTSEVGQLLETNLDTGLDLFEVKHRQLIDSMRAAGQATRTFVGP